MHSGLNALPTDVEKEPWIWLPFVAWHDDHKSARRVDPSAVGSHVYRVLPLKSGKAIKVAVEGKPFRRPRTMLECRKA
jgi:hypothetical protein